MRETQSLLPPPLTPPHKGEGENGVVATPRNLMDEIYRRQRHIYDLTRKYYLLGRDRLIGELDVPEGGTVLELGCGTGRNLILAARRYPQARFFGLDLSSEMLRTAEGNIARAGLSDRIRLAQGDASKFDAVSVFAETGFDRVFFSYALSMIPPWREAIQSGLDIVAPGGSLHVVDFGGQERLPAWFGTLLRAWLAKFHVTPRGDLETVLADLALARGGTLEFGSLYRDYARLATISIPA